MVIWILITCCTNIPDSFSVPSIFHEAKYSYCSEVYIFSLLLLSIDLTFKMTCLFLISILLNTFPLKIQLIHDLFFYYAFFFASASYSLKLLIVQKLHNLLSAMFVSAFLQFRETMLRISTWNWLNGCKSHHKKHYVKQVISSHNAITSCCY